MMPMAGLLARSRMLLKGTSSSRDIGPAGRRISMNAVNVLKQLLLNAKCLFRRNELRPFTHEGRVAVNAFEQMIVSGFGRGFRGG
jgi:hypothetical protein